MNSALSTDEKSENRCVWSSAMRLWNTSPTTTPATRVRRNSSSNGTDNSIAAVPTGTRCAHQPAVALWTPIPSDDDSSSKK